MLELTDIPMNKLAFLAGFFRELKKEAAQAVSSSKPIAQSSFKVTSAPVKIPTPLGVVPSNQATNSWYVPGHSMTKYMPRPFRLAYNQPNTLIVSAHGGGRPGQFGFCADDSMSGPDNFDYYRYSPEKLDWSSRNKIDTNYVHNFYSTACNAEGGCTPKYLKTVYPNLTNATIVPPGFLGFAEYTGNADQYHRLFVLPRLKTTVNLGGDINVDITPAQIDTQSTVNYTDTATSPQPSSVEAPTVRGNISNSPAAIHSKIPGIHSISVNPDISPEGNLPFYSPLLGVNQMIYHTLSKYVQPSVGRNFGITPAQFDALVKYKQRHPERPLMTAPHQYLLEGTNWVDKGLYYYP